MKLSISLASLNGFGAMAGIESTGGVFEDQVDIAGSEEATPAEACLAAAKALRLAARRFELLAGTTNPLKADVQTEINGWPDSEL